MGCGSEFWRWSAWSLVVTNDGQAKPASKEAATRMIDPALGLEGESLPKRRCISSMHQQG
jgi:hypothetical protein